MSSSFLFLSWRHCRGHSSSMLCRRSPGVFEKGRRQGKLSKWDKVGSNHGNIRCVSPNNLAVLVRAMGNVAIGSVAWTSSKNIAYPPIKHGLMDNPPSSLRTSLTSIGYSQCHVNYDHGMERKHLFEITSQLHFPQFWSTPRVLLNRTSHDITRAVFLQNSSENSPVCHGKQGPFSSMIYLFSWWCSIAKPISCSYSPTL